MLKALQMSIIKHNIIPDVSAMQIFVINVLGKSFTLEVDDKYDFVEDLKGQIQVNIKF